MASVEVRLPAEPWAAFLARRLVRAYCRTWLLEHIADDAELVTSECVTAALVTYPSAVILTMAVDAGELSISVGCEGTGPPDHVHVPEPSERTGSIFIVNELASTWGVDVSGGRRRLWFQMGTPAAVVPAPPVQRRPRARRLARP